MDGVDWVNGDSLIISRTQVGSHLFEDLLANNLVIASRHQITEVIKGQHVEARLALVAKELHTQHYLNRYREIEKLSKDEIISIGQKMITKRLRRKRITSSLLYRTARKLKSMIKHLR